MTAPDAGGGPTARALVLVVGALGVALVAPTLFSDPNGVDPHALRLSGVATGLTLWGLWRSRLRPLRPMLLAMMGVTVSYSVWSATPWVLARLPGGGPQGGWAEAVAGVTQMAATMAVWAGGRRLRGSPSAFRLRLGCPSRAAAVATIAGPAGLIAVALAAPATLLGRLAIQPLLLQRQLWWVVPATVLQGAAQEIAFRGLLLSALEDRLGDRRAAIAQGVVFGLGHLAVVYEGPTVPLVPVTIALGIVLGLLTQRTRSLWPALVVHAIADLLVAIAVVPGLYGL